MGYAAYNRGSEAIRKQISAEGRPVEFLLMDRWNAIPKIQNRARPWIRAYPPEGAYAAYDDRMGVWWLYSSGGPAEFGYWYKTMEALISSWDADVVSYAEGTWLLQARTPNRAHGRTGGQR